jgi:hypothetical protein
MEVAVSWLILIRDSAVTKLHNTKRDSELCSYVLELVFFKFKPGGLQIIIQISFN